MNGFYLIWAFNFQKNRTVPYKSWKNFFKIGRKGYQKKRNFALISKMCRNLASRSFQRFFLRKTKSLKILFFFKHFFPFCQTRDFCTFLKSAQNSVCGTSLPSYPPINTQWLWRPPSFLASPGSRPSITVWFGKERSNVRGLSVYSSSSTISSPNAVKTWKQRKDPLK